MFRYLVSIFHAFFFEIVLIIFNSLMCFPYQVTYFQCGGSSIGISCSVLLADLMFKENFLKKWANIHHNLLSDKKLPVTPFYNFQHAGKNGQSNQNLFVSIPSKKCGKNMIFNVAAENVDSENDGALKICVEEAENKLGFGKLFVKINSSSCSVVVVENFRKEGLAKSKLKGIAEAGWMFSVRRRSSFMKGISRLVFHIGLDSFLGDSLWQCHLQLIRGVLIQ